MKSYTDLIDKLKDMGEHEVIQNLGELYATDENGFKEVVDSGGEDDSLSRLLAGSFTWGNTPEGYRYWDGVWERLREVEEEEE